jgi:hypothetical protein
MFVPTRRLASQEPSQPPRTAPSQHPTLPVPMIFEEAPRPRWEYHVVAIDPREDEPLDETFLASLGAEGWLLAAVLDGASGRPHARICYYFVRAA